MKKVKFIILNFLFVFNTFNTINLVASPHPNIINPTIHKSYDINSMSDLCQIQIDNFEKQLLGILNKLFTYKQYWQKQQVKNSHTYLPAFIYKRLYNVSFEQTITSTLTKLHEKISFYAQTLGQLIQMKRNFSSCLGPDTFSEIQKVTLFISAVVNDNHDATKSTQFDTILIRALMLDNINKLEQLHCKTMQSLADYAKPGHFKRHWGKYVTLGITCLIGTYLYKNNNAIIDQCIAQAPDAAKNSFHTYISNPLKNIIFNNEYESLIPEEMITKDKDWLKKTEHQLLLDINDQLPKDRKKSPEQINKTVDDAIQNCDLTIFDECYNDQVKNPLKNLILPNGVIGRLFIVYGLNKIVQLENIAKNLEEKVFKANRLNFELMMTVPAVLGLYTSYKLCNHYRANAIYKFYHRPIQRSVRSIETILTDYSPTFELDFLGQGLLHYWINRLARYKTFMSIDEQLLFCQDLDQLSCPIYSVQQKKEVIARMYHTYKFLSIGHNRQI